MKIKIVYWSVILILVAISGVLYVKSVTPSTETIVIAEDIEEPLTKNEIVEVNAASVVVHEIYVYLCGAITTADVYKVKEDTRLFEVVALAGGLTEEAASEAINLARVVVDGERIYFPSKEEVVSGASQFIETNGTDSTTSSTVSNKVSINNGTKEQLMSLTGIGEVKATAIIKYREKNGAFKTVEDVMRVEGIKEAMFEKIKDDIVL